MSTILNAMFRSSLFIFFYVEYICHHCTSPCGPLTYTRTNSFCPSFLSLYSRFLVCIYRIFVLDAVVVFTSSWRLRYGQYGSVYPPQKRRSSLGSTFMSLKPYVSEMTNGHLILHHYHYHHPSFSSLSLLFPYSLLSFCAAHDSSPLQMAYVALRTYMYACVYVFVCRCMCMCASSWWLLFNPCKFSCMIMWGFLHRLNRFLRPPLYPSVVL